MDTKNIENVKPDVVVAGCECCTRKALVQAPGKSEQTPAGWSTKRYGPAYMRIVRRVIHPQNQVREWLNSKRIMPETDLDYGQIKRSLNEE